MKYLISYVLNGKTLTETVTASSAKNAFDVFKKECHPVRWKSLKINSITEKISITWNFATTK